MLGDIVGYCVIKKGATAFTPGNLEDFYNKPLRVLEFATDGGVFVIDSKGSSLAAFNKEDILSLFRCSVHAGVICPPDLDILSQMAYSTQRLTRKGGYDQLVRHMVVLNSLRKGFLEDAFLFQVEKEEQESKQNKDA